VSQQSLQFVHVALFTAQVGRRVCVVLLVLFGVHQVQDVAELAVSADRGECEQSKEEEVRNRMYDKLADRTAKLHGDLQSLYSG